MASCQFLKTLIVRKEIITLYVRWLNEKDTTIFLGANYFSNLFCGQLCSSLMDTIPQLLF